MEINTNGHPVTVISTVEVPVVIFVSILVGILLTFAIICLCFNIVFRNDKLVNSVALIVSVGTIVTMCVGKTLATKIQGKNQR